MTLRSFKDLIDAFEQIPTSFLNDVSPRYRHEDYVRDQFMVWFNECHGPLDVVGHLLWPAEVLRLCDPVAFDKEFNYYLSDYNELWVDTRGGWLEYGEVGDIVDAWELLPETEQSKYLNDCGCGGCDDCDEEEEE